LLVQQIQTISAERDDATALVQHAQNELTNLRTIFDEVLAEKNALLIEQGCLMESNSHKQTQLDKLQTQLNNAITIQKEAAKSYQDLSDSTASIQKLNSQVENAKRNEIAKLLSDLAQAKEETAVKNSDLQRTQAEFDASRARILDLEAQLDPLQERVKELQELTDGIPNIQHSLECARSEAKQLPVLQEQVKQSTAHDLKALAPNT
jgi:chromosome segregation ATPase